MKNYHLTTNSQNVKSFFKLCIVTVVQISIKKMQNQIAFLFRKLDVMPTYPEVGTILSWGSAQLEPVITGVKSIMVEFIPYVIYVAIGVLLATLWFVAVKWLMNWMSRRVTWTFSSRRKRR